MKKFQSGHSPDIKREKLGARSSGIYLTGLMTNLPSIMIERGGAK